MQYINFKYNWVYCLLYGAFVLLEKKETYGVFEIIYLLTLLHVQVTHA